MDNMSRRRFISDSAKLAGGVIGASALGTGILFPETTFAGDISFPETSFEAGAGVGKKLLVAYESDYGSTAEVAVAIGKSLHASGHAVDVLKVDHVQDVNGYDGVVVGSPIQYDKWMPKATAFVQNHQDALSTIPVAYFFTCMTLSKRTEDSLRTAAGYADKLRAQVPGVKPVSVKGFGGAVDFSKMSLFTKMMLGTVLLARRVKEGDYRDWNEINSWSCDLKLV